MRTSARASPHHHFIHFTTMLLTSNGGWANVHMKQKGNFRLHVFYVFNNKTKGFAALRWKPFLQSLGVVYWFVTYGEKEREKKRGKKIVQQTSKHPQFAHYIMRSMNAAGKQINFNRKD